jgi:hypothetical protein
MYLHHESAYKKYHNEFFLELVNDFEALQILPPVI